MPWNPIDDDDLEQLLDQRFETDHGAVPTREATAVEIDTVLQRITGSRIRLIERMRGLTDQDRLDHLAARSAALAGQAGDLRIALAWATAKQDDAESRWADYLRSAEAA